MWTCLGIRLAILFPSSWVLCVGLLLSPMIAVAAAQTHISVAVNTSNPSVHFNSGPQSNRVSAAQAALAKCREVLAKTDQEQGMGVCELVRMDGIAVTTAEELLPRGAAVPLYLWRFKTASATVYLAGTIHVLKPSLYPLPPQFLQAYQNTNNLVFEVDLSRYPPVQVRQLTRQYAEMEAQSLRQSLPADTYQQLVEAGRLYGLPVGQMQAFKPMLAFQQLGMMSFLALGYDPDFGIDHYFGQLGQKHPEQVLQLETLEFQFNLLLNQPLNVQNAVLQQALDELPNIESETSDMISAYFAGRDAELLALIENQVGDHPLAKAFNQQLIDQRNKHMARKITGYLDTPDSYFVLVGAAHLIGHNGIVAMLERAGFPAQRIYSDQLLPEIRR